MDRRDRDAKMQKRRDSLFVRSITVFANLTVCPKCQWVWLAAAAAACWRTWIEKASRRISCKPANLAARCLLCVAAEQIVWWPSGAPIVCSFAYLNIWITVILLILGNADDEDEDDAAAAAAASTIYDDDDDDDANCTQASSQVTNQTNMSLHKWATNWYLALWLYLTKRIDNGHSNGGFLNLKRASFVKRNDCKHLKLASNASQKDRKEAASKPFSSTASGFLAWIQALASDIGAAFKRADHDDERFSMPFFKLLDSDNNNA